MPKNYRDKKEEINYYIGHTHSGHEVGCRQRLLNFTHAQIKDHKEIKKHKKLTTIKTRIDNKLLQ